MHTNHKKYTRISKVLFIIYNDKPKIRLNCVTAINLLTITHKYQISIV